MRTNFVLIDSENVKPEYLEKLQHEHFRVVVFVGASLKWLDFPIVNALQSLGSNGSYVKVSSHGPNALDFHIAYHIGKLSAAHPGAHFHIISRDKGFDPLIKHLKDQKVLCSRWASVLEIPSVKSTVKLPVRTDKPPKTDKLPPTQRAAHFYEKRLKTNKARPATLATLQSTIASHFRKLSAKEVGEVVEALTAASHVVVNGKKVAYPDPG